MEALMQTWSFFVDAFTPVWENLCTQPSLWLAVTLVAYAFGMWLYKKSGFKTIFTPLLTSIVIIVATLLATHTDYATYMQGGQHINFLLGPATVALAVPLYEQRLRLAKLWIPLTCGLVVGAMVAIVSTISIAALLGASRETVVSLAPKSVTVPIAVGISEHLGGIPALTAALVVITGVTGALLCRPLFAVLREKNEATRGFAIGLAAHGVGTATAFQMSRDTGAFSGLAMGLTGLLTAFIAPWILQLMLPMFF